LRLHELEVAMSKLKICPKCHSIEGFWFKMKDDHLFTQCKSCGAEVEICEMYKLIEENKKPLWLKIFNK